MTYFITNPQDQPINVIHNGAGPRVQISKKACNSFTDIHAAKKYLAYLQGYAKFQPCIKRLKISTYAKGWMK